MMKRVILIIIGTVSLALGTVGIILPVLPTTPFFLLSLFCYLRSSKKLYSFVLTNKYFSRYVKDYISGNGIPLKAKKRAIFLIWLSIGFTVVFAVDKPAIRIMLIVIALCVSTYIWTRKTLKS